MTFGLTPKYSQSFPLDGLTKEQFLKIVVQALEKLNWKLGSVNEDMLSAFTKSSLSSWSEEIKLEVVDNTANVISECKGDQLIDWGKNKKNVLLFIETIQEFKSIHFNTEPLSGPTELLQSNELPEDEGSEKLKYSPKEKIKNFVSIFIPTKNYFITPILINLNIIVFVLMAVTGISIIEPTSENLLGWGANLRPITLGGEFWRLITCCFIHIGIIHLLMNMYALLYIGVILEPYLGKSKFLSAYLTTGLIASVSSIWWHDLTVSAGASGAIFGMYGVFIALLSTNIIDKATRQALLPNILLFTGYNLLFGLKGGVDNAAHIGGLLSGIAIGYAYIYSLKNNEIKKISNISIVLVSGVTILFAIIICTFIPNNMGIYDQRLQNDFVKMEEKALSFYQLPENAPVEQQLTLIKDTGLFYWNKNKELLVELGQMELPEPVLERNNKLIEYCDLRMKFYELLYKSISENSRDYDTLLTNYDNQINKIINSLQ